MGIKLNTMHGENQNIENEEVLQRVVRCALCQRVAMPNKIKDGSARCVAGNLPATPDHRSTETKLRKMECQTRSSSKDQFVRALFFPSNRTNA